MNATLTGKVTETIGYICVETSVTDCEGTKRTIDFPRATMRSKVLYGAPVCHWTVKTMVNDARKAARCFLKTV